MKPLVLVLLVALSGAVDASEPFWDIFKKKPKPKPVITKKVKKTVRQKEKKTDPVPKGYRVVDVQWWSNYLELADKWQYRIPEDENVWSSNGKYLVPIVVYRHYDDMRNASENVKRRSDLQ